MASGQLQNRSMMQKRLQDLAYVNELVSSADGAGGGLVQFCNYFAYLTGTALFVDHVTSC